MKRFPVVCLSVFLGLFLACNKPSVQPESAPEVEFKVHDTLEYFYDNEPKVRIVCTVDCDLPVDSVWWGVYWRPYGPGQGSSYDYSLMQKQDGKFIYVLCVPFEYTLTCRYRLSIGGWRYNTDSFELHVTEHELDSIQP